MLNRPQIEMHRQVKQNLAIQHGWILVMPKSDTSHKGTCMQRDIPLVMVHGLFGPLHFFQPTIRMSGVAAHPPAVLVYGGRPAPTELSLPVQANEIVRFLHALDSGPCHLLGHSVGAAVAMLSAELAPQLVKSIISA